MRDDLADPQLVLEKLKTTARNDSVSLWKLSQNTAHIRAKLADLTNNQ
jgi:hypothetical protein